MARVEDAVVHSAHGMGLLQLRGLPACLIGGMDIAGCLRRMLPTTCLGRIPHTRCFRRLQMTYAGHDDEARLWLPAWSAITFPILVRSVVPRWSFSSRPSVFSARGHTTQPRTVITIFAISRHRASGITSRMLVVTKSLALVAFRRLLRFLIIRPSSATRQATPPDRRGRPMPVGLRTCRAMES